MLATHVVVSEVPGTTRDPVDTPFRYHGRTLVFVDTAGLRRQSRVKDSLEYYSSLRTARVVQEEKEKSGGLLNDVNVVEKLDSVKGSMGLGVDQQLAQQAFAAGDGSFGPRTDSRRAVTGSRRYHARGQACAARLSTGSQSAAIAADPVRAKRAS